MTRTELYEVIRTRMSRPNLTDGRLALAVRSVEGEMNRVLREHPRQRRQARLLVAAGATTIAIPTDLMEAIALYDVDGTMLDPQLDWWGRGTSINLAEPATAGYMQIDYLAALIALTDATSNWVATYYPDIYTYGVMAEVAMDLNDTEHAQQWRTAFLQRLGDLRRQGWAHRFGELQPSGVARVLLD
jgi:hypothetical protein